MKHCKKCNEDKPLDDFHNDKHSPDGKTRYCKVCNNTKSLAYHRADPERAARHNRETVAKNPTGPRDRKRRQRDKDPDLAQSKRLMWKGGFDLEEYYLRLAKQADACDICGTNKPGTRGGEFFCVDHDRNCCKGQKSCGKCIRGIVCHRCNTWVIPVYEGKRVGNIDSQYLFVRAYMDEYAIRRAEIDAACG